MGKYSDLSKNVYSVFDLAGWKALNIKTFPNNFIGIANGSDYIRVSVIPSGDGVNLKSSSGLVNIDIFVKAGLGPNAIYTISDSLDNYLVGKSITIGNNVTQFKNSSVSIIGVDKDNSMLFRAIYAIPFNHYGV